MDIIYIIFNSDIVEQNLLSMMRNYSIPCEEFYQQEEIVLPLDQIFQTYGIPFFGMTAH